jgi:hypothetical protein
LDYLPGTVIRGALAHCLLTAADDKWTTTEPRFREAFTLEHVRFGPLYPTAGKPRSGHDTFSFPAPAAVQTCKYASGVIESAEDARRIHGAKNVLWDGEPARCRHRASGSDECNASLVPLGGYLQAQSAGQEDWELRMVLPRRRSIQRTEIHDQTLSSQRERLYSTEVIPANTWFTGYVWGPRESLQELADYIATKHDNRLCLRVGKSLTRGHGAIELAVSTSDARMHTVYPILLPEVHATEGSSPDCDVYGKPRQPEEFSLYLYSDMISVDRFLRPVTHLDKQGFNLWHAVLGQTGDPPFEIMSGYCTTRRVGGFNGEAGLPRTPDIALVAGSTWRLRWRDGVATNAAIQALNDAVRNGAGLRRGEGFGGIILNLPLLDFPLNQPLNQAHRFEIPFSVKGTLKTPAFTQRRPRRQLEPEILERQRELLAKLPRFRDNDSAVAMGLARLLSTIADCDTPAQILKGTLVRRSGYCSWHGKYVWSDGDRTVLGRFAVHDESGRKTDARGIVADLKNLNDYPMEEQAMLHLLDESQRCGAQDFKNLLKRYVHKLVAGGDK